MAAAGLLVYLISFYAVEFPSLKTPDGTTWRRVDVLQLLLVPEVAWQRWTGETGRIELGDRAAIWLWAGAIWGVMIMTGWWLLRASRFDACLGRAEAIALSGALGASAWSLYTLAVGLAGGLHQTAWFWLAAAISVCVALAMWLRSGKRPRQSIEAREPQKIASRSSSWWIWLLAATPFIAVYLLAAPLPPADFDVLEYHLQAPKEFYEQGSIGFLPHNVYGNMPLCAEMLCLLSMLLVGDWWQGALVGKVVLAGFAPLTALAIWAAGCRLFRPAAGGLAALVYLSTPWIYLVSTTGLVEGVAACYWLLAVYAIVVWQQQTMEPRPLGWIAIAGAMAGTALAVKYPAALFVVVPLAGWIVLVARRACARPFVVFLALVCATGGPWLVKNAVLTGNPTYPLLSQLFDGATRTPELNARWERAHAPPNYAPADLANRAIDVTLRSEWLSPLLVPLIVIALVARRRHTVWSLAGYFAVVFALWWLFTHRIDRFWVPALGVLALAAGGAIVAWADRRWAWVAYGVVAVLLVANLVTMTSGACGENRYFVILSRLRTAPEYLPPWYRFLNVSAPGDRRVLCVGDAAVFELEMPLWYNTTFDASVFEQLVRPAIESQSDEAFAHLHRQLADEVSYVYVHWGEIARYRSPGNYGFTEFVQPGVFETLVARGVLGRPVEEFADSPVQIFPVLPLASP